MKRQEKFLRETLARCFGYFTERSRLIRVVYYMPGFLLLLYGSVIRPWALRESNALQLANKSAPCIGYEHKAYNIRSYLALINRAGGLYGRILTEVVSTDRTQ